MKRQLILFLLVLLSLSACSSVTKDTLSSALNQSATQAESEVINMQTNISKGLYSYYLPPNIGRKTSSQTSTILTSNNINILMNLEIIDVISDSYYIEATKTRSFKSMVATADNVTTLDRTLIDSAGNEVSYRISILTVNDNLILLTLEGGYFYFTAITPISISGEILYDMIKIARTAIVDKPAVLLAYSTRESIDYKKETLDMFSQIAPESGTILDMISGGQPVEIPEGQSQ
jgi:uncharacterized protein YceK